MSLSEKIFNPFVKFAIVAAIVSLCGLVDSIYLTVHHYTAEPVPCSLVAGCEMVLTSQYATMGDIPLGVFGIAGYLSAFLLSLLTIFGKTKAWILLGLQVVAMALFTSWLLYLQAYVIKAFCQFCLLSAATTFTLLIIVLVSRFWRAR